MLIVDRLACALSAPRSPCSTHDMFETVLSIVTVPQETPKTEKEIKRVVFGGLNLVFHL